MEPSCSAVQSVDAVVGEDRRSCKRAAEVVGGMDVACGGKRAAGEANAVGVRGNSCGGDLQGGADDTTTAMFAKGRQLASAVKSHHARLRQCVADALTRVGSSDGSTGGGESDNRSRERMEQEVVDTVWKEHIADSESLAAYAFAMGQLSRECWPVSGLGAGEDRISWCLDTMHEYFVGKDGLASGEAAAAAKDRRREAYQAARRGEVIVESSPPTDVGGEVNGDVSVQLLDVGSCSNLFVSAGKRSGLVVNATGVDIAPAVDSVHRYDIVSGTGDVSFAASSFDVVVFCLLLSYMPTTQLRYAAVRRARSLLRNNGLFLLITPDSKHVGKGAARMKNWKKSVEGLRFRRWRYCKLKHMHCMAFRAVEQAPDDAETGALAHQLLVVPACDEAPVT